MVQRIALYLFSIYKGWGAIFCTINNFPFSTFNFPLKKVCFLQAFSHIAFKTFIFNFITAAFMQFPCIRDFLGRIISAHLQTLIIYGTKPVVRYIFTCKNQITFFIFSPNIKSFVRRKKKLHNFKIRCRISIKAVHITATFTALQAFSRNFVFHFFRYKIR